MSPSGRNLHLEAAVRDAEARYARANPRSAAAFAEAQSFMPGGNTRTVLYYPPFPLTLASGSGCRVTDVDGHSYIDTISEQTAGLYGHSEPVIAAAVQEALQRGIVLGGPSGREAELAALLCERFPALEQVRFVNSGTEANLYAVGTARAVTGRPALLAFEGSYHGGVMSYAGYSAPLNVPFPVVLAPYNDIERTVELIDAHADELAAVIMEPMVGSGGCIRATDAFVRAVRDATARHGILLIFDEVMTSRLSPGGLHAVLGVNPDLLALGKYLGGGLTFGAFGGRADLMARFDPTRTDVLTHAGTFNNNVLSLAAGIAGLRHVLTPEASLRINADGDRLRERLIARLAARGVPGTVTGYGSMMMIQLAPGSYDRARDTARVPNAARALCQLDLIQRGLYVSRRNMINLSLPMGPAEFDAIDHAFDRFLEEHGDLLASGFV